MGHQLFLPMNTSFASETDPYNPLSAFPFDPWSSLSLKDSSWIDRQALERNFIRPYVGQKIKESNGRGILSWGLSSYGYDLRLSSKDFRVFRVKPGEVIDPLNFQESLTLGLRLQREKDRYYFTIPPHTYALGVAVERLCMPPDVFGLCIGKSTYARAGLILNTTPIEPGWEGHLTLEMYNATHSCLRVYANQGICQTTFFQGRSIPNDYAKDLGKYMNQPEKVVFSKVFRSCN